MLTIVCEVCNQIKLFSVWLTGADDHCYHYNKYIISYSVCVLSQGPALRKQTTGSILCRNFKKKPCRTKTHWRRNTHITSTYWQNTKTKIHVQITYHCQLQLLRFRKWNDCYIILTKYPVITRNNVNLFHLKCFVILRELYRKGKALGILNWREFRFM